MLVEVLRDQLGLTGTKIGCETSVCGACTVLLDEHPVKSCTILAVQADRADVTTIEGLSVVDGLTSEQEAFGAEHGLQCGYCTPGMIVSATALLRHTPDPGDEDIHTALDGNLCRCTGYAGIVRAVRMAAALRRGESPEPQAGRALEEPLARRDAAAGAVEGADIEVV